VTLEVGMDSQLQARFKNTMEVKTDSTGQDEHAYFCRGCGLPLPPGSRILFHEECLKQDKRLRVRKQRQRQHEQFARWLRQQTCRKCGARWTEVRAEGVTGIPV